MAFNRKQNSVKELPAVEILRNLAYLAPSFCCLLLIYKEYTYKYSISYLLP